MNEKRRRELIDELIASLHLIKNRLSEFSRPVFQQFSLTPTQWQIIRCIAHYGLQHQKDIAEHLGISRGAVAQQIDELIQKGLIEKVPDRNDRRKQILRLTEKTSELKKEIFRLMMDNLASIFSSLTEEELAEMVRILKKIRWPAV